MTCKQSSSRVSTRAKFVVSLCLEVMVRSRMRLIFPTRPPLVHALLLNSSKIALNEFSLAEMSILVESVTCWAIIQVSQLVILESFRYQTSGCHDHHHLAVGSVQMRSK